MASAIRAEAAAGHHPCLLLHIVPNYGIGGVELAAESAAMQTDGLVRVHFLSTRKDQPAPKPCRWMTQDKARSPFGLESMWRAMRQIRESDPEILLFSLWRSAPAFLLAKLLFPRKRFVLFLHNESNVHWPDALGTRLMLAGADEIWSDSGSARARTGERGGTVISMIIHAPSAQKRGAGAAPASFISWCRLNRQKRMDRALRLIARLKDKFPQVHYTAIGPDGGELESLQSLRIELGLERNVEFLGPKDRPAIQEAAASARFFVQLSDYEGQSMAVMEAMQLGLIPVVTPVGGIPTYSADGVNAVYFDDVESAAGRLERLIEDPVAMERMSGAAKEQFASVRSYTEDILNAARSINSRAT